MVSDLRWTRSLARRGLSLPDWDLPQAAAFVIVVVVLLLLCCCLWQMNSRGGRQDVVCCCISVHSMYISDHRHHPTARDVRHLETYIVSEEWQSISNR